MVTGSSRLPAGRSGVDFTVQLDVPWNAPEAFLNMNSAGLHELDIESMPDVLGLRARQPGSVVICVMTGRDSRKALDRGYHDVTLVDMNHVDRGPGGRIGYVTIDVAGASRLRHVQITV